MASQRLSTIPAPPRAAEAAGKPDAVGFLARLVHDAAWRLRLAEYAWPLVEKELASTAAISWRRRPALWRRGYLGEAASLYDFETHDWRLYLSDYARFVKTRLINGAYGVLLDDKLLLPRLLRDHGEVLPKVFGTLRDGHVVASPGMTGPSGRPLSDLLRAHRALVLKPVAGGGGRGVRVLRALSEGFTANGKALDADGLEHLAGQCEGYMVGEFVEQHPAIAALYPESTNTLRIVTMRDDAGIFVAAAVQRIGCARSRPTDNWTGGGLSAVVDRGTGRLGKAASYPAARPRLAWYASHPETGAAIEGAVVPRWPEVEACVLDVAGSLPFLPYVGWDVVVTESGPRILEGNQYSDVNLLQIHGPLLADERVAAFYRRHKVID